MADAGNIKKLVTLFEADMKMRQQFAWQDFMENTVHPVYTDGGYTPFEVRAALGWAFEDKGYEAFEESYGYPEDEDEN